MLIENVLYIYLLVFGICSASLIVMFLYWMCDAYIRGRRFDKALARRKRERKRESQMADPIREDVLGLGFKLLKRWEANQDNNVYWNSWKAWLAVNGHSLLMYAVSKKDREST